MYPRYPAMADLEPALFTVEDESASNSEGNDSEKGIQKQPLRHPFSPPSLHPWTNPNPAALPQPDQHPTLDKLSRLAKRINYTQKKSRLFNESALISST